MKEKLISEIMKEMLPSLDNEQLKKLKDTLEVHFYNVSIISRKETAIEKEELDYLAVFLSAKRIEGCSEKTLLYYKSTIQQMLESVGKSVCTEYSCAVTPQIRQTGNRLSGNAGTAYASLLA